MAKTNDNGRRVKYGRFSKRDVSIGMRINNRGTIIICFITVAPLIIAPRHIAASHLTMFPSRCLAPLARGYCSRIFSRACHQYRAALAARTHASAPRLLFDTAYTRIAYAAHTALFGQHVARSRAHHARKHNLSPMADNGVARWRGRRNINWAAI